MITDKNEAILEVGKDNPNFKNIDEHLLSDKDVALTYMQRHSSNIILVSKFPINIDVKGMIDDKEFMIDVINNLSIGYNNDDLNSLLKYSANQIVRAKLDSGEEIDVDTLKQVITEILTQYHNAVKAREEKLSKKKLILDELDKFVAESDVLNNNKPDINDNDCERICNVRANGDGERYRHTDIGFTAKF